VRLLQTQGIAATKIGDLNEPGAETNVPLLGANTTIKVKWSGAGFDATAFTSEWGAQAQTFGWTERELLGLHPAPDLAAANYSPLARLDDLGLIWLLRGRPVITLTKTGAIIRCPSGASVTYRRRTEPAPADIAERATT
jgi:hypothetical protein